MAFGSKHFLFKTRHLIARFTDRVSGKIAFGLIIAALFCSIVTYIVLLKSETFEDKSIHILPLIYVDVLLLALLALVISKRILEIWKERKKGLAGSRLHVQLVTLFSGIAITPAILVAVFSLLFFNVGVKSWFSEPVKVALNEAATVAEAYLQSHQYEIRQAAYAIVNDLRHDVPLIVNNAEEFSEILTAQVERHGLVEALVISGDKQKILARSSLTFALEFEKIPLEDFDLAQKGDLRVLKSESEDRVRALVRLDPVTETYLYLGKYVDPDVLRHVNETKSAVAEYHRLENQTAGLHITFIIFFGLIALILLLASIWVGLSLAHFLILPVRNLIKAADEVRQGNLKVSIETVSDNHEFSHLADAFNKMITQLYFQQKELLLKNEQLDYRRQLIEGVLSGVSSGVLGIDRFLKVDLVNERAIELLDLPKDFKSGPLQNLNPDIMELVSNIKEPGLYYEMISIKKKGHTHNLQVCIVPEFSSDSLIQSYVATFDDVTELLSAQRKAAWADVARRIAHEIKNPLTPIQLSAERLKRKYLKEIQTDPAIFQGCIDTIVRQVNHIGRLIGEFSAFARMPEPVLMKENLAELCRQAIFLQQQAHQDVTFNISLPENVDFLCDAQQIGQVLTNLLQNGLDALEEQEEKVVYVNLITKNDEITLIIADNGPGFPLQYKDRLTEPYFTMKEKGTGLGLAIVLKIVQDHKGTLELSNGPQGGAAVIVRFSSNVTKH